MRSMCVFDLVKVKQLKPRDVKTSYADRLTFVLKHVKYLLEASDGK